MLKVFFDTDNIGLITDTLDAKEHSHYPLQLFLSKDDPLKIIVDKDEVYARCIAVGQNAEHKFASDSKAHISVIVEAASDFSRLLNEKIAGNYAVFENESLTDLQNKAKELIPMADKKQWQNFMRDFKRYLGIEQHRRTLDERITQLLALLKQCDCFDHTVAAFAKQVSLSPSRLSHLFRQQIGVPLKSYIVLHQTEKAFAALLSGTSITDASMFAGFDSPSHFAATVKKLMGQPASAAIKNSEFLKVFL